MEPNDQNRGIVGRRNRHMELKYQLDLETYRRLPPSEVAGRLVHAVCWDDLITDEEPGKCGMMIMVLDTTEMDEKERIIEIVSHLTLSMLE